MVVLDDVPIMFIDIQVARIEHVGTDRATVTYVTAYIRQLRQEWTDKYLSGVWGSGAGSVQCGRIFAASRQSSNCEE